MLKGPSGIPRARREKPGPSIGGCPMTGEKAALKFIGMQPPKGGERVREKLSFENAHRDKVGGKGTDT